jgi:hypothetical protein
MWKTNFRAKPAFAPIGEGQLAALGGDHAGDD